MRFADRILFVTGGASGLGRATAERVVAEGGKAVIVDLDPERAKATAAEIGDCIGVGADVSDEEQVRAALAAAVEAFGGIDFVLAAAGHADFDLIEDWDVERFQRMINVHLGGTFLTCKHTTPIMKERGRGSIVTVASIAALMGTGRNTPYGAAKAGIVGFTRHYALEALPEVRVNCVAPGRVVTGMTIPLLIERGGDLERGEQVSAQGIPMSRMGRPGELAGPITFLFSDDASFITGQTLVVDGGETIS